MNIFPAYESLAFSDACTKISKLTELGKPEQDFLYANISAWKQDPKRELMLKAQSYYKNDNDINQRERYYIDRKGVKQIQKNLSNSKLAHPYLRLLTNQKVNYLLSKEFTLDVDDKMAGADKYIKLLESYFNKQFRRMLKNVGTSAILNGIAWLQVYYNADGNLSFKRIPSEEVIPFWADAEHTQLEAVIRNYSLVKYNANGYKTQVNKIEYYTSQGVWYYEMGEHGLKPDPDAGAMSHGHFIAQKQRTDSNQRPITDTDGNPVMDDIEATWERVPFVGFKYNADELSLLKWVKPLIDDYDINSSDMSNNLQDVPNSIKVVRNYEGSDPGEFVQNLNTFRTAFVSGDGDVTALNTPLDTVAVDSHLNRVKHDIYEAGNGVNTQDENLGNASGVALKFRYAGLDMDMSDMANEFSASLEQLIWFIDVDIAAKGLGDFAGIDVDIVFNTDQIMNETEIITSARDSVGIISDETIIANHPWVRDASAEMARMEVQKQEAIAEQIQTMALENSFGNPGDGKEGE